MGTPQHLLYGSPPASLVTVPDHAVQTSPLMLGAKALESCATNSMQGATLLAPPSTLERRYVFAQALRALAVGAPLTALALKDKGGSRIASELKAFGCDVHEDSRNHYRICTTTRPEMPTGMDEAIEAGGPLQHPAHGLWTQAGIFSFDRIDTGSAALLKHLPMLKGAGADLGCGLGVLSNAALVSPDVTAITLIDNDRRAVAMAERNLADARATFVWADIRDDTLAARDLDFIIMNPPFHDQGIEDKSLGQLFITRAGQMLKSGGKCWLTANKHLPYEALLRAQFRDVQLIAEEAGFKIYMSVK